jgi:hypothetical protein
MTEVFRSQKGIPHQGRSSHEIVSFDEVFADLDKGGQAKSCVPLP